MKKKLCCFLSSLILICVLYISLSSSQKAEYIKMINDIKYVDSEVLLALNVTEEVDTEEIDNEEVISEDVFSENVEVVEKIETQVVVENNEEKTEEVKEETIEEVKENVNVNSNEIITGKMTAYGPDCYGCSGYLAYGTYVGDGTIYYNDSEYGMVRIVAGDKKYKFGTIVRINDEMLAIVLDRGGSIGIGKKFLFDLLYPSESEASIHGVKTDVKFEILRNGF